ncbi:hypothetical protein EMEDMD4_180112 [Sinorhizobium medicae]|uniref:Uncharacterized protein n=1 Tax=Sinorhizobium medicae TaxID=110321 RepID=A0A508WTH7_9HYPH|nr:hypothetical protein EMEDMD4_180112 [Sinorhizobium medicae]
MKLLAVRTARPGNSLSGTRRFERHRLLEDGALDGRYRLHRIEQGPADLPGNGNRVDGADPVRVGDAFSGAAHAAEHPLEEHVGDGDDMADARGKAHFADAAHQLGGGHRDLIRCPVLGDFRVDAEAARLPHRRTTDFRIVPEKDREGVIQHIRSECRKEPEGAPDLAGFRRVRHHIERIGFVVVIDFPIPFGFYVPFQEVVEHALTQPEHLVDGLGMLAATVSVYYPDHFSLHALLRDAAMLSGSHDTCNCL